MTTTRLCRDCADMRGFCHDGMPCDSRVDDPIKAIKLVLYERNLKKKDLAPYLGCLSMCSEIMNYKRRLTLNMIRKLHNKFGISAELLIQDYELKGRAQNDA